MLFNLFRRNKGEEDSAGAQILEPAVNPKVTIPPIVRISLEEQKLLRRQRKQLVIDEFGKSIINLRLQSGILTPLHIVDLHRVRISLENLDRFRDMIESRVQECLDVHRENLQQRLYRESFNLQPGHLLVAIKDIKENKIVSFKDYSKNLDKFLDLFSPVHHELLLIRYFIPPIPDDMHQFDNVELPPQFEAVLTNIVNFCDLNYSSDNLTFEKWESLVISLDNTGVQLNIVNKPEEMAFLEMLTTDYGEIGYRKVLAKLILKDKVEKRTVVIPLFVILLAFFCSDQNSRVSFPYHFLFSATGDAKKKTMEKGDISFFKLFNQLLDESLSPDQFNKCLAIIYNEAFRDHKMEIDDLLLTYRERYNPA